MIPEKLMTRPELEEQGADQELLDVRDFHMKFGLLTFDRPVHLTQRKGRERVEFLQEEVDELNKAIQAQDLAKIFDACLDIVYVAKGTAVMYGFTSVWHRGWNEVQRTNMAKVRGITQRGHQVDVMKPPGWLPPDLFSILCDVGYEPSDWGNVWHIQIKEDLCVDDAQHKGKTSDAG